MEVGPRTIWCPASGLPDRKNSLSLCSQGPTCLISYNRQSCSIARTTVLPTNFVP